MEPPRSRSRSLELSGRCARDRGVAGGFARSGLGAGHVADGRAPRERGARNRGADARPRPRHDARRHRRDVRRRRCRGDRRRSAIAGRRDRVVCGEQGVSAQRGPKIGDCGLRAQSAPVAHRSHRSLSAALARTHSARRDRRRVRAAARRGQDRTLGRVEFRPRGDATRSSRCRRDDAARRTRCSITWASAVSNGISCRGCASGACRSWRIRRWGRVRSCAVAS